MLTDRQIQAAIKSCTAMLTLNDGAQGKGTGSLRLKITPRADGVSAVWYAWWKRDGQRRSKAIGRYPDMTLALARQTFGTEIRTALAENKNPRTVTPKHDRPTVAALFAAYVEHLRAEGAASANEAEYHLLRGAANLADTLGRERLAREISPADISAHLFEQFKRGKRRSADISRAYASAAYNWGIRSANSYTNQHRRDWGLTINPAAQVEKDSEASKPRERNLSADELARLLAALEGSGFYEGTAEAIRLLIYTGQRVRETLRADGRDFDLEAGLWNMPAEKTKMKLRPHVLPLPPQAIEVVRRLVARHGAGPLFPARAGSKADRLADTSLNKALGRWAATAGLDPFQTRDIRRTWKSRTGELGIDRFTRDLIQQHAREGDTGGKHYDRADYLPQMRAAMDKWGEWLGALALAVPD